MNLNEKIDFFIKINKSIIGIFWQNGITAQTGFSYFGRITNFGAVSGIIYEPETDNYFYCKSENDITLRDTRTQALIKGYYKDAIDKNWFEITHPSIAKNLKKVANEKKSLYRWQCK